MLGGFFIWSVCKVISMPEFSPTLLVLMGITNGTYLGFKPQEKGPKPLPLNVTISLESDTLLKVEITGGTAPYKWKLEGPALTSTPNSTGELAKAGESKLTVAKTGTAGDAKFTVTDKESKTTEHSIAVP